MKLLNRRKAIGVLIAGFGSAHSMVAQTKPIRIVAGTIAPQGTPWYQVLQRTADQWRKISGDKVQLVIQGGGQQGDEDEMLRKVGLGTIQVVGLSGVGLSKIAPGVGALQLPMLVDSYAQLDHIRATLEPRLEQAIANKNFVVLNWSDVGFVYFFSKKPIRTPSDLKQLKLFTTAGDANTERLYRDLGFRPIPLAITDMLQSLATGLIEAFDVPPLFALSDQSFALAKNMLDVKWAPVIGATVIDRRAWEKIPEALRPELLRVSRAAGDEFRVQIRAMGDTAIEEMKSRRLNVVSVTPDDIAQWRKLAVDLAYPKLRGAFVPADYFDEAIRLSKEALAAPVHKK